MAANNIAAPASDAPKPRVDRIRSVAAGDCFAWIAAGWRDMRRAGSVSLLYGAAFVVAGFAITGGLALAGWPYLITPMCEGFMLVAPLAALGLYDVSRRLERGEALDVRAILLCWRPNQFHMMTGGLIYMLYLMIWARLAVIIFAVCLPNQPTDLQGLIAALPTVDGIAFIITSTLFGGALATIAFVTNVVTHARHARPPRGFLRRRRPVDSGGGAQSRPHGPVGRPDRRDHRVGAGLRPGRAGGGAAGGRPRQLARLPRPDRPRRLTALAMKKAHPVRGGLSSGSWTRPADHTVTVAA